MTKFAAAFFILMVITSTAISAGGSPPEVGDGSTWVGGGHRVTADITDPHWSGLTNVYVTVTDSSGTSNTVNGDQGATSTPAAPTASESEAATTPDGDQFRVKNGRLEYKGRDGKWRRMRKLKNQKNAMGCPVDDVVGVPGGTITYP